MYQAKTINTFKVGISA